MASVTVTVRQGVREILLDRQDRRNALDATMQREIAEAITEADDDAHTRAILLTGAGTTFASGADIDELATLTPTEILSPERRRLWQALADTRRPVVAGVAGFALGGGCELALACDLIVAGDDAYFGQPELRLGLLPGAGGSQRWARAVGRYRAAEVVLADRWLDAWEAQRRGIVAEVVPAERVVPAARRLARLLADGPPLATAAVRRTLDAAEQLGLRDGLEHDRQSFAALLGSEDAVEGTRAFVERRRPQFRGV